MPRGASPITCGTTPPPPPAQSMGGREGVRLRGKGPTESDCNGGYRRLERRLEQRLGGQCLADTNRLEGRWGRAEGTGSTDRHANEGGGGGEGGRLHHWSSNLRHPRNGSALRWQEYGTAPLCTATVPWGSAVGRSGKQRARLSRIWGRPLLRCKGGRSEASGVRADVGPRPAIPQHARI